MDGITFYGRYFNVITMNTQSQKVSMAEKIGYSLGDCSANLVFQMMMIYQTKFYTDIFGCWWRVSRMPLSILQWGY